MTITEPTQSSPSDPAAAVSDDVIDAVMAGVDAGGLELLGPDGVFAELTKRLLEQGLAEEPSEHLGYRARRSGGAGVGQQP